MKMRPTSTHDDVHGFKTTPGRAWRLGAQSLWLPFLQYTIQWQTPQHPVESQCCRRTNIEFSCL